MSRAFHERLIQMVREAHPDRNRATARRRMIKLMEETGELAQAYLSATSRTSRKGKTWDDVREESADCFIVSTDIVLMSEMSPDDICAMVELEGERTDFEGLMAEGARRSSMALLATIAESGYAPMPSVASAAMFYMLLMVAHDRDEAAATESVRRKLAKWKAGSQSTP